MKVTEEFPSLAFPTIRRPLKIKNTNKGAAALTLEIITPAVDREISGVKPYHALDY